MQKKKLEIPKFSKSKLNAIFKTRKLEDLDGLKFVDDHLRKKRGYVFKLPKKNEPVILLFSGGLDSTTTCALLMDKFKLNVYPVFFKTDFPRNKYEFDAATKFAKIFTKKYGNLFHPIKVINYAPLYPPIKPTEPVWNLKYDQLSNGIRCIYAMKYAYQLEQFDNVKIRTIFTSHISTDGTAITDQTLAALRKIMFYICLGTNDYSWQVSALGLEKELGYYYGKDFQIAWAEQHNIPLELTRTSCYRNGKYHCGECAYCQTRKEAFKQAGVIDRTIYTNKSSVINDLIIRIKQRVEYHLHH